MCGRRVSSVPISPMSVPTSQVELYRRGLATLVASWEAIARGSRDAAVTRAPGVTCAVFPHEPERAVYNNALLGAANGIDAMESAYAAARISRFAVWVHERDAPLRAALEVRGYTLDTATRAMGMTLDAIQAPRPEVEVTSREWRGHLAHLQADGVPRGLLAGVDPEPFHVVNARHATAL